MYKLNYFDVFHMFNLETQKQTGKLSKFDKAMFVLQFFTFG